MQLSINCRSITKGIILRSTLVRLGSSGSLDTFGSSVFGYFRLLRVTEVRTIPDDPVCKYNTFNLLFAICNIFVLLCHPYQMNSGSFQNRL